MTDPTDPTINPLQMDAQDLLRWVEAKSPRAIRSWRDLGTAEYARAFAVANTAGQDVIDDLYFGMVDTIERGGTEKDYADLVTPIMQAKGWLKSDANVIARRVNLIYTMNLRFARASGKWDRIQTLKASMPYLRCVTARDERVRKPPKSPHSDHTAWDGIILPVDHPFFRRWFPPLGFRCRCSTIQMTRSQLARFAGGVTGADELAAREARLGDPIFASPAMGIDAQLAETVAQEPDRMDGLQPINPQAMKQRGSAVWDALMAEQNFQRVSDIIGRLFDVAA